MPDTDYMLEQYVDALTALKTGQKFLGFDDVKIHVVLEMLKRGIIQYSN